MHLVVTIYVTIEVVCSGHGEGFGHDERRALEFTQRRALEFHLELYSHAQYLLWTAALLGDFFLYNCYAWRVQANEHQPWGALMVIRMLLPCRVV